MKKQYWMWGGALGLFAYVVVACLLLVIYLISGFVMSEGMAAFGAFLLFSYFILTPGWFIFGVNFPEYIPALIFSIVLYILVGAFTGLLYGAARSIFPTTVFRRVLACIIFAVLMAGISFAILEYWAH